MDYEDDTLTNANKNRAASRKLFQQWCNNTNPTRATDSDQQQKQHNHLLLLQSPLMSLNSLDPQQQQQCPSASPSPHQVFLHRSPSGAQRKIRQKVQQQQQHQQNQQQFPLINNFSMSSALQQQQQPQQQAQQLASTSGRSVIHENGYKSLLDRDDMTNGASPSLGQLMDRMNRLDSSPIGGGVNNNFVGEYHHRPVPAADCSVGGGSIDKMPPMPLSSSPLSLIGSILGDQTPPHSQQHFHQQHQQPFSYASPVNTPFTKPTVQVHPLPVPPRHRSLSAIAPPTAQLTTRAKPPPLPPKKHSLTNSFLMAKRGSPLGQMPTVENVGVDEQKSYGNGDILRKSLRWAPSAPSTVEEAPPSPVENLMDAEATTKNIDDKNKSNNNKNGENHGENEKQQNGGEAMGEKGWHGGGESAARQRRAEDGAAEKTPSPAARPTTAHWARSPPLSLSNSPSLTSLQNSLQFAAENPDKHSGEQLEELEKRRLYSIESLARKIADREQDRELLCRDLAEIDNIRVSLFTRVSHNGTLVGRLNNLLTQTEKLASLETKLHFQMERMALSHGTEEMVRCLREQLLDLRFLRSALEERESAIDAEMAEELNDTEGLQEWLFCREQLAKLSAERCHLNMRLRDVRTLLDSLQGICLIPATTKKGGENGPKR